MEQSAKTHSALPGWRIRQANPEDVLQLTTLSDQLGYPVKEQELSRSLRLILPRRDHAVFVAVDTADHVLGWIHIFARPLIMEADGAELGGLVVARDWRERGIGRALILAAEHWARGSNLTHITLRSNTSRTAAREFYLALNFQLTKTSNTFKKHLS